VDYDVYLISESYVCLHFAVIFYFSFILVVINLISASLFLSLFTSQLGYVDRLTDRSIVWLLRVDLMVARYVVVSCDILESITGYQSTIDLSNLNQSVFTDCPEALNDDNYNASQISSIAQQALNVSVQSPSLLWVTTMTISSSITLNVDL